MFCGNKTVVTAPSVRELFDENEDEDEGRLHAEDQEGEMVMCGTGKGKGKGKEIVEIPMCVNCAVACENDDRNALLQKALRRIYLADGGLSRLIWQHSMATHKKTQRENHIKSRITRAMTATIATTNRNLLGGDSSMDMVSPPPPDISHPSHSSPFISSPPSSCSSSPGIVSAPAPIVKRKGVRNEDDSEDETLARLHYYRQAGADPRFATLECIVPVESALYVSIFGPVNTPAFRPQPTKPLPEWMRLLPRSRHKRRAGAKACQDKSCCEIGDQEIQEAEGHQSPHSVLDIHFPPAATFPASQLNPQPQVDEDVDDVGSSSKEWKRQATGDLASGHELNGNGNKKVVRRMTYPDAHPPLSFVSFPPPPPPPAPRVVALSPAPSPSPSSFPARVLSPPPSEKVSNDETKSDECISSESSVAHLFQSDENGDYLADDTPIREELLRSGSETCTPPPLTRPGLGYLDTDPDRNPTPLTPARRIPYKRPSIISDEPLRQPSSTSRLVGVGLRGTGAYGRPLPPTPLHPDKAERGSRGRRGGRRDRCDVAPISACIPVIDDSEKKINTKTKHNGNAPHKDSTISTSKPDRTTILHDDTAPNAKDERKQETKQGKSKEKGKGKGKTVVWDESVAGGETETETDESDHYCCCVSEENRDDTCCDNMCEELDLGDEDEDKQLEVELEPEHIGCEMDMERTQSPDESTSTPKRRSSSTFSPRKPASFSLNPNPTPWPSPPSHDPDPDPEHNHQVGPGALWRRITSIRETRAPPAQSNQSNEFLDLYRRTPGARNKYPQNGTSNAIIGAKETGEEKEEARKKKITQQFAHPCSLAMPGRRRGREIGTATATGVTRGVIGNFRDVEAEADGIRVGVRPISKRICPTCGNMAVDSLVH